MPTPTPLLPTLMLMTTMVAAGVVRHPLQAEPFVAVAASMHRRSTDLAAASARHGKPWHAQPRRALSARATARR
jgi:hypothetical protein